MPKTITSTYDVTRRTVVTANHARVKAASSAPKRTSKPKWKTALRKPDLVFEIIGDGDKVLIDGLMTRDQAIMVYKFLEAINA
ncbi:hypothetical protein BSL82_15710 [Tardibacter chloracetimidivorans]|uniref:Uncharacterized protein n=1 Tax=Tardibacter chloracetimidivorans TaxID=1921510 RepID=A0A1L3ZY43_9SPHN|nr:hypothetical protein [Tardibacter chloracetimidivorans]API60551.1 hypothetical protein BSL82_15710 [Tardibacter chloracetimidivorans]